MFVSHRARMSGEFDSRKDSQSTKFEWRMQIFVKLSWMVFFAFNQYWATNFHSIFFAGNISVLFATWNDVSIYFVSNVTSYPSFYFSQMLMLCKKEVTILHIHGKKSPSHKAIWLKFRISFTKFLRNLIMISICEKVRLQQLRKTKCSTLASILRIFLFFFFFYRT